MTAETLKGYTCKDLAEMAKKQGVSGWHSMRKDQLVKALLRAARRKSSGGAAGRVRRRAAGAKSAKAIASGRNGAAAKRAVAVSRRSASSRSDRRATQVKVAGSSRRLKDFYERNSRFKNLATVGDTNGQPRDRLIVMVRDPYWLHAYWELSRHGVERAQAALGQDWHASKPTIRLYEVGGGTTTSSVETVVRDITIHGGVNNWYVDVIDPPKNYRLDIGYLSPRGRFFVLARSNIVSTPKADAKDLLDENWAEVAENYEKIYAQSGGNAQEGASGELQELFEERLRRPMGSPLITRFGPGAEALMPGKREFFFAVDAELIVYGCTESDAHVTLQGEPVKLRPDGSFTMRFSLPNCRQVIPAVACSSNGLEQRTVVLAVERNTKTMEPLIRDGSE